MNRIPVENLKEALLQNKNLSFAYLFGSAANGEIRPDADVDIAVYFSKPPGSDDIYEVIKDLEDVLGEGLLDLLILNGCNDFVLRNEVIKGKLLLRREPDRHASFFSWTLRMYEDQMMRLVYKQRDQKRIGSHQ